MVQRVDEPTDGELKTGCAGRPRSPPGYRRARAHSSRPRIVAARPAAADSPFAPGRRRPPGMPNRTGGTADGVACVSDACRDSRPCPA
jgi:hypothetical protein